MAAAAEPAAADRPRSRVILTGPQIVSRGGGQNGSSGSGGSNGEGTQTVQSRPAPTPPPSTQLPPRIVNPSSVAPVAAEAPRPVEEPGDARQRFEAELQKARQRTVVQDMRRPRPDTAQVEPVASSQGEEGAEQTPVVARDPSRPAVGSVIALPPRIKITERTPVVGRPPPGAAPANPIRCLLYTSPSPRD